MGWGDMASEDVKWFVEAFNVSRETCLKLQTYEALLLKWQKTINLIGPSTVNNFWRRHVADSAQLLSLAPKDLQKWVDIGSGGGFPGLVIAILLSEPSPKLIMPVVHLIESDQRKCTFMRTVVRETQVSAQVHEGRIEDIVLEKEGFFSDIDIISARALAPLPKLLDLAAPYFENHTKGLFLKGKNWKEELKMMRRDWKVNVEVVESITNKDARILICGYPKRHPSL